MGILTGIKAGIRTGIKAGPLSGIGAAPLLLDASFTAPAAVSLPSTIAAAQTITGRTFSAVWRFSQASGSPAADGSFTLTAGGSPRFQKTCPVWDGSSMIATKGVEFPGGDTTTNFASPSTSHWDLTQSLTFVACMRLMRPPASDRGFLGKRAGSGTAGWNVRISGGIPALQVGDGSTSATCSAPGAGSNELDGFANGTLQWWAFKMDLTAGKGQVLGYRTSGTLTTLPAGSKSNANAFQVGGQPFLFNCELMQLLWLGALVGSEAEAFDVTALNALDTHAAKPSVFASYSRSSVCSPRVAGEVGFGLRVQHCHGSLVTTGLVQFPHMYHPSATLSAQKLAAYFARGTSVAAINKKNFYTQTDDLSHADWTKTTLTAVQNSAEDPSGFTAAASLTATAANAKISQTKTVVANTPYAHSFYVRRNGGSDVSLVIRAVDTSGPTTIASANVTATSEWTRVELTSLSATATNVRYELEIVSNAASIYATFAQLEYGWPTEYQPQRSTLIDRGDPTYYIDNSDGSKYKPRGGKVEVTSVQYVDDIAEDYYLFSTGLSDGVTPNRNRMLFQVSDALGSGGLAGTINEPYNTEVQHHDDSANLVVQITNFNINRAGEGVYSYEWTASAPAAALSQPTSATSLTGPLKPMTPWSHSTAMPKLHPCARYTNTTHLEGGIERLRIWGEL